MATDRGPVAMAVGVHAGLARLGHPPDWLTAVEDRARLRADLERTVPELASGELQLISCKFKRARLVGAAWSVLCRLEVERPGGDGRRTIDVGGAIVPPGAEPPPQGPAVAFAGEGWRCRLNDVGLDLVLAPPDVALASMAVLTDPAASRALIEGALRDQAPGLGQLELARCTPSVMRLKDGRRCTIRYELGYQAGDPHPGPDGVVAKLYEGDEGRTTYDGMRGLWASPLRTSTTVTIAEPLALVPDLHVLVQGLVPGERSLKDMITTAFAAGDGAGEGVARLSAPVRRVGRGLAEVHASGVNGGATVSWASQLDAVRGGFADLERAVPELAGAAGPLLSGLDDLARAVPAEPLVPTHGSFRPAQVLVDHDDIAFIDFDGFCRAEAGLDLAHFCNTLCDLCLRASPSVTLDRLDDLVATFLEGYAEVRPVAQDRLAVWDMLTSANDILDCWRKIKFEHLDRRMGFLLRQLDRRAA